MDTESESRRIGYVVTLKHREGLEIYGIDVSGRILGSFLETPAGKRTPDDELFADAEGDGIMKGKFEAGKFVSIKRRGFEEEQRRVVKVREIEFERMDKLEIYLVSTSN